MRGTKNWALFSIFVGTAQDTECIIIARSDPSLRTRMTKARELERWWQGLSSPAESRTRESLGIESSALFRLSSINGGRGIEGEIIEYLSTDQERGSRDYCA